MTWDAVEDAIRAWVKAGGGLPDGQVYFGDQNGPKAPRPLITITLGDVTPLGLDDAQELVRPPGDNAPAGQEIEIRAGGVREFTVTVIARTASTLGATAARALLTQVQTAARLESVRGTFADAGISLFDTGRILNTTTVLDAAQEGRAQLVARFYCVQTVSEYTGYIATVNGSNTATGATFTVTEPT